VDGIEQEFRGKAEVIRLNVDELENERIQQTYGVCGHPSIVIVDGDGQVTERFLGAVPAESLQQALNKVIQ
jgi:thioredoxin-like negative regulator of GroEL